MWCIVVGEEWEEREREEEEEEERKEDASSEATLSLWCSLWTEEALPRTDSSGGTDNEVQSTTSET
jgi:hypothetical protein